MTKTYSEKLKDPRWQKRRLEALSAAEWRCTSCGDAEKTLHVHHRQYFKGREPWDYEVGQLEVLCVDCHTSEHEAPDDDMLLVAASFVSTTGHPCRDSVASLLAGFCKQSMDSSHVADPAMYVAGEVAFEIEQKCMVMPLVSLLEALRARDRWTVRAALDAFVLDLKTRPDAPVPPLMGDL